MRLPDYLASELHPVLAQAGFHRNRRSEYVMDVPDGVAGVSFVRPGWSVGASPVSFTAHVGFFSRRLAAVFGPGDFTRVAGGSVHWHRWVGYIEQSERGYPSTWTVSVEQPFEIRQIAFDLCDRVLPALSRRASDVGIRDDWLVRADPTLGRATQLSYLAVLVRAFGPDDKLASLREQLQQIADRGSLQARLALRELLNSEGGLGEHSR